MSLSKIFLTVFFSIFSYFSAQACPTTLGSLTIKDPVIVFYNGNVPGAGYLTIHQAGSNADKLLSVRLVVALQSKAPEAKVELHSHVPVTTDGQLVMQMVAMDSINVPAAIGDQPTIVEFKKGGMHLMLYSFPDTLKEELKKAEKVALILTFEKAGEVTVNFKVTKGCAENMKNDCSCPNHEVKK